MKNYAHGHQPGLLLDHAELDQHDQMHNMLVDLFGDVPPADEQSTPFAKLSKKWLLVLRNLSMITKITQTCLPFLAG
jgi:hypothetical protein